MSGTKMCFALFAPVLVIAGVVISPAAASKALAGDYQIAYAIDARGVKEAGKYVECTYLTACRLGFENTTVRIVITADGRWNRPRILVHIYDGEECCYFSDGNDTISLRSDKPYRKLPIFEGKKKLLNNEHVLNTKIGDVFLGFADFKRTQPQGAPGEP
jgi:hypothetical protein